MKRAVVLAIALWLASAGSAFAALTTWRTATVSVTAEATLVSLIGAEHRRVCGTTLVLDGQLVWVARWKAMDMGLHGVMSHRDAGGHRTVDFFTRVGVVWTYGWGEIIGWNTYPLDVTAQTIFRGWMSSPAHRAAIRNCDYDRFGVGTFRAKDRKWYAAEFTNVRKP